MSVHPSYIQWEHKLEKAFSGTPAVIVKTTTKGEKGGGLRIAVLNNFFSLYTSSVLAQINRTNVFLHNFNRKRLALAIWKAERSRILKVLVFL